MHILFLAFLSQIYSMFYFYKFVLTNKPKLINHFIFIILFSFIPVGLFVSFLCQHTINNQEIKNEIQQQNAKHNNE